MKIYRVYSSFHESDESGTNEYGVYSTLEKAQKRMEDIATSQMKDTEEMVENGEYCVCIKNAWGDWYSIKITEYDIDIDYDYSIIGYT